MGNACSPNGDCFHSKYRLGDLLGKGSQGKVYLCMNRATNEKHAVKIIDRSVKTAWSTYRREVELCAACDSGGHTVRVIDHFTDAANCYVIMDRYVCHLRKALKWVSKDGAFGAPSSLDETAVRNIMRQATIALAHLHELEIVHRDVKAQNFLSDRLDLRTDCTVVLGDFGLARRLENGHVLHAQVGTRKYWPVEMYDKHYWNAVDVFALGVLLFLASTGTYPYPNEENVRQRDIFSEEGVISPMLSDSACDFMRQCLEKNPAKRMTAAALLQHRFFDAFKNADTKDEATTLGECKNQHEIDDSPSDTTFMEGASSPSFSPVRGCGEIDGMVGHASRSMPPEIPIEQFIAANKAAYRTSPVFPVTSKKDSVSSSGEARIAHEEMAGESSEFERHDSDNSFTVGGSSPSVAGVVRPCREAPLISSVRRSTAPAAHVSQLRDRANAPVTRISHSIRPSIAANFAADEDCIAACDDVQTWRMPHEIEVADAYFPKDFDEGQHNYDEDAELWHFYS